MKLTGFGLLAATLVCSCTPEGTTDPGPGSQTRVVGGIEYRADTRVAESYPVQLHTTVTVTNRTEASWESEWPGGCPLTLLAYRSPSRTGEPAWDQSEDRACILSLQLVTLEPGEQERFATRATATEILGDSLPDGPYYLAVLAHAGQEGVKLAAGEADLER
ncbi:MAG: hypothetical protein ACREKN_00895 [Longimicrobiaceae bacterium]